MKKFIHIYILLFSAAVFAQIDANSLMGLPTATNFAEIMAISTPNVGSIVFNLDDEEIYRYTGTTNGWQRGFNEPNVYVGSFIISEEGPLTVTGIPFQPSQVTFAAHANVEDLNLDSNNGTGVNDRGIANSFGSMTGFVRNINGNLVQQAIFGGGHGNSINDISKYASSTNCIGVRYGDQNGSSLGKIEGAFNTFTTDGFTINVNYTDGDITVNNANPLVDVQPDDIDSESLVVLYTAYK